MRWLKSIGIVLGGLTGMFLFILLSAYFFLPMLIITAIVGLCGLVKIVHDEMD